jgi:hypothetical protein
MDTNSIQSYDMEPRLVSSPQPRFFRATTIQKARLSAVVVIAAALTLMKQIGIVGVLFLLPLGSHCFLLTSGHNSGLLIPQKQQQRHHPCLLVLNKGGDSFNDGDESLRGTSTRTGSSTTSR